MSETIEKTDAGEGFESPEDAVHNLAQQLEASEAAVAAERQRREAAERQVQQASSAVAGAHESSIQARLSAQESAVANARSALKQARETGDIDAESDAVEALATARQTANTLKAEHSRILAERSAPPPARQQQGGEGYSPAAQAWINRNPRFNSDPIFQGAAIGAHNQAIASGMAEGSPAYFQHLDNTLARTFGGQQQGGDDMGGNRQPAAPARPQSRPPASSYATPPGRGNAATPARGTDAGSIASQMGVTTEDIQNFADAAGMKLADYCKSQADILAERRRGGSAGFNESDRVFK